MSPSKAIRMILLAFTIGLIFLGLFGLPLQATQVAPEILVGSQLRHDLFIENGKVIYQNEFVEVDEWQESLLRELKQNVRVLRRTLTTDDKYKNREVSQAQKEKTVLAKFRLLKKLFDTLKSPYQLDYSRNLESFTLIDPKLTPIEILYFKDLKINLTTGKVIYKSQEVRLNNIQFKFLSMLAKKPGKVFSFADIAEYIWGNPGTNQNTISSTVKDINKSFFKISDEYRFIEAEKGVGVVFWQPPTDELHYVEKIGLVVGSEGAVFLTSARNSLMQQFVKNRGKDLEFNSDYKVMNSEPDIKESPIFPKIINELTYDLRELLKSQSVISTRRNKGELSHHTRTEINS